MTPIRYAGFDPDEGRRGYYPSFRHRSKRARAYVLFRDGFDTLKISHIMNLPECKVLKFISIERAARNGYPSPYEGSR